MRSEFARAILAELQTITPSISQAGAIAALGVTANISNTVSTPTAAVLTDLSTANTYTDAAVNAIFAEVETALLAKADQADLVTVIANVVAATEARLDAIEAKIDATIAALKAGGIMAT